MSDTIRTLLCYGDSNTHGTCPITDWKRRQRHGPDIRWPGRLAEFLGRDWTVIEEGLPGRTTAHDDPVEGAHKNGLTVLPAILESHRPLDAVVVMLGTNDLKPRFSLEPFDIALSAERLVRCIQANGCGPDQGVPKILLICPPPVLEAGYLGPMYRGGAEKSRHLAPFYAQIAARNGVDFLDAGAHVTSDPTDGVHWDADAHAALAPAVAQALGNMSSGKGA